MTKKSFMKAVAEQSKVSLAMVEAVLAATAKVTAQALVTHGQVRVPGVASLVAKQYEARPGRNPKTGEASEVPAATRIRVKPATSLQADYALAAATA